MKARVEWAHATWEVDLQAGLDISIRLTFDEDQPNAFGLAPARATPFAAGDFIADTRVGGSVNCFDVTLNPHGNGTHTECVGHIVDERVAIADVLDDILFAAQIVTVDLVDIAASAEQYDAPHDPTDLVITAAQLAARFDARWPTPGLVIRTAPNSPQKQSRLYSGANPPYPTADAMRWIRKAGIKHLLVDVPSVDREDDRGQLPNHRILWDVEPGSTRFEGVPSSRTITEMIYVPDEIGDAVVFATLQIPHFALDAAPSRVRVFPAVVVG